jgi:hypothetical protein
MLQAEPSSSRCLRQRVNRLELMVNEVMPISNGLPMP